MKRKYMKEMIFETYKEMIDFLNDSDTIDEAIIEASKIIIENPEKEINLMRIRCKEINKFADLNFTQKNMFESLSKVLNRKIENEEYEICYDIKLLLDKLTKNDVETNNF